MEQLIRVRSLELFMANLFNKNEPPQDSLLHLRDIDEHGERAKIPNGNGLMLRLDNSTGSLHVEYERDAKWENVHPNCFAPASMREVRLLKGGGSGTAVFSGHHPSLKKVVMKHAGPRDTEEVMSLALISKELLRREGMGATEAAKFLRSRIPQFLFCYISPHHVRDRTSELWNTLRKGTLRELVRDLKLLQRQPSEADESETGFGSPPGTPTHMGDVVFQAMKVKLSKRDLYICSSPADATPQLDVKMGCVTVRVPDMRTEDCVLEQGYDFLDAFTYKLAKQQEKRNWKCTLAQSCVGGPTSENGASVLVSGRLQGSLLRTTIRDFIKVMEYLRQLSLPHERAGIHAVREEVKQLEQQQVREVASVSMACNEFVGTAVRKNFMPKTGRFPRMREYGALFRSGGLVVTQDEHLPALFLGRLLQQGSKMSDVFVTPPSEHCALDHMEHGWFDLLKLATSFESNQVNDCIWTCGLTDAGLHNTFVSKDRGLELFDLGSPQLMPMPAFLTKFLMSFFHTLGMEDVEDEDDDGWVVRFECTQNNEKLRTTESTTMLAPNIYSNFAYTMDHLIQEVFEGDDQVRELLLTYTTLQLLSDAAFCLDRWEQKGGGRERLHERNTNLSKWLWRSLWDLYVASRVYETLLLPLRRQHHHHDDDGGGGDSPAASSTTE